MRKAFAFVIALVVLLASTYIPALAENSSVFSADALQKYCDAWNEYFQTNNSMLNCGYSMTDDNTSVHYIDITYNIEEQEIGYSSGIIPSTACIYCLYSASEDVFGFGVFSDQLKTDLQNLIIYTDDTVINDITVQSDHDTSDMWSIFLSGDNVLNLFSLDQFTMKMTIDGKTEFIDISKEENTYLYNIVFTMVGAKLYSDTTYENYLSSTYLPEGLSETSTTEAKKASDYSFQKDYEKVDQAAKSLFYVETYDNNFNILSSASGFVTFDEHLFVTNQHVIEGASILKIWDDDNNVYFLDKVIISDKAHDLAILLFTEGEQYHSLELDAEEVLKRGQPVVTIGSPEGYQNTVAYGNISAFPIVDGEKYIQFTAPISHGSSGGCLFDDYGKVIGITSAGVLSGENIGLAIPVKELQELYLQWDKSSYKDLGTKRSWDTAGAGANPAIGAGAINAEKIEEGIFINRYGMINKYVNIRSAPTVNSLTAGEPLPVGKHVYLVINKLNAQGEMWTKVIHQGKEGYIKSEYIDVLSEKDHDKFNEQFATLAPVCTATPEPTAKPENAESFPTGNYINQYGIINHSVNFRLGPSTNSSKAGDPIKTGEYVYMIKNEKNRQGEIWTKIKYNGKEGYVKSEYIDVMR